MVVVTVMSYRRPGVRTLNVHSLMSRLKVLCLNSCRSVALKKLYDVAIAG